MGLFTSKSAQSATSPANNKIEEAEIHLKETEQSINDAIMELGKVYYEDNKDKTDSAYASMIKNITEKYASAYLWKQYRLSLEGQRICDSCKSIITSESAFCNKCGAAVSTIDFSPIMDVPQSEESEANPLFCRKCGKKLIDGALFCDVCGTKRL